MAWHTMSMLQKTLAVGGTCLFAGSALLLAAEIFGSAAFSPVVWKALGVGAGVVAALVGMYGGMTPEHKEEVKDFAKDTVKQSFRDTVLAFMAEVRQRILRLLFPGYVGQVPAVRPVNDGIGPHFPYRTRADVARSWASCESEVDEIPGD